MSKSFKMKWYDVDPFRAILVPVILSSILYFMASGEITGQTISGFEILINKTTTPLQYILKNSDLEPRIVKVAVEEKEDGRMDRLIFLRIENTKGYRWMIMGRIILVSNVGEDRILEALKLLENPEATPQPSAHAK
jgi:hypothetical protein